MDKFSTINLEIFAVHEEFAVAHNSQNCKRENFIIMYSKIFRHTLALVDTHNLYQAPPVSPAIASPFIILCYSLNPAKSPSQHKNPLPCVHTLAQTLF